MTGAEAGRRRRPARCSSGAIMLGAALVFVMLFRRLGLGATLGYIVAGALIGPQVLGLVGDPEQMVEHRRNRHRAAAVPRRAGASARAGCGGCARTFSGSAWRRSCCAASRSACSSICALGVSAAAALAIGLPLGLSSTAQVLPMLRADGDSTRRRASGPSRSCCSRTCRSCR